MAFALSPRLSPAARPYRLPWHVILIGDIDRRTRRSFAVAGGLGLIVLGMLLFAPAPVEEAPSIEAIPERLARLILEEKPKPATPAPRAQAAPQVAEAPAAALPAPPPRETPKPAAAPGAVERAPRRVERVAQAPRVAPDQGIAGRREAEAATQALAGASKALDATLAKLSSALPAGDASAAPPAGAARGRLRRGRGQEALGGVGSGVAAAAPAGGGPVLLAAGLSVDIGEWSAGGGEGGTSAAGAGGHAAGTTSGGDVRSNASLLAVLQRYAPGIRYCYDNALKRDATLGGKLVLRLTVEANGSVSEAAVLEDGLKSAEVLDCVLAQVKAWNFGAVPAGRVSFRAPFVFTPGQ